MLEINSSEFEKEVLRANNVVVDFYSTECAPCEALAPQFEDLSKIYEDIKFLKIMRQQNRELAEKFGVRSSPTLLFFKNGKEATGRLTGGIRRSDIIIKLENMISSD